VERVARCHSGKRVDGKTNYLESRGGKIKTGVKIHTGGRGSRQGPIDRKEEPEDKKGVGG